mmetsp:Transcript_26643/g.57895  ORF Transcript_26643/g.57895 Transcript_26643/m.57895 type:complete len:234 (+) Transcript_26643:542-1243(+)
MIALFSYLSLVDDDDFVGVHDGGEPVRDDDDTHRSGHSLHHVVQGFLNLALVLGIQGTCSLVQEQKLRPPQKGPSDRQTLLLPTRESAPALAEHGVVPSVHGHDEVVSIGLFGGSFYHLVVVVSWFHPIRQILFHRASEDLRFLADHRNTSLVRSQVVGGQRLALHEHLALLRVVEAEQELHGGALAAPRLPHECHCAAGRNGERQVGEDLLVWPHLVRELHVFELDGGGGAH